MKKNLNRTVALALAVMLVACFPFAVNGEEAAAETPVQTEEVIEVSETVEPAAEESVPQPVSIRIITLNLGSTEFYYDDLMLGANIDNATSTGIRWQICKAYVRDGANEWVDYKYDEVIHVTVEPGIENWAFRCILPSGDMSQEFVVNKTFGYRPAEEEVTEETEEVIVETEETEEVVIETEVTEEVIVETEAAEDETDEDDFVEFDDDELVEFNDDDWGTTEGSDFSELDNLANGVVENAVEVETEEVIAETETEEEIIEEVTEEAVTPAAEAEEITDVVVEEEKEEANEEIEEVTEKAEIETPAVEAEEITDAVVEEEKEEEIEEVTEKAEIETPAVEAEEITEEEQTEVENAAIEENLPEETEEITEEIEEVTEEAETETPAVEDEEVIEEEQTEVINVEIEEIIPEETEESTEEIEEVTEETETETPAVEGEEITEEEQTKVERYYTITTSIDELGYVMNGDDVVLYANLFGYDNINYTVQWVYSTDTVNWIEIPEANELSLIIEANADNFALYWDVIITIIE